MNSTVKKVDAIFNRFNFRGIIAMVYIFFSFAFIYVLCYRQVPDANRDMINVLAGVLITGVPLILKWYFETSKDKADSDAVKAINTLSDSKQQNITTETVINPENQV